MALISAVIALGIYSCTPAPHQKVQRDGAGNIVASYSYYVDSHGKEVLHGDHVEYSSPNRKVTRSYKHGKVGGYVGEYRIAN
jgi:hypothetical protein